MSFSPGVFRQQFSAFKDPAVYNDTRLNTLATLAVSLMDACRWGDILDFGTMLFVAHHLVLDDRDILAAAAGGSPGEVKGPPTSKTVDKVSASYDATAVTITDANFWNMTVYGIRFYYYLRLVGAGGVQIGVGHSGPVPSGDFGLFL